MEHHFVQKLPLAGHCSNFRLIDFCADSQVVNILVTSHCIYWEHFIYP